MGGETRWQFNVGSHVIIASLDANGIESVKSGPRLLSRSGPGGKPEGHTFALPGADSSSAPISIEVRFDPFALQCTLVVDRLTENGGVVPASSCIQVASNPTETPVAQYFGFRANVLKAIVGGLVSVCVATLAMRVVDRVFAKTGLETNETASCSLCIAQGDLSCATTKLAALESAHPNDHHVRILKGQVLVLQGDLAKAKAIESEITVKVGWKRLSNEANDDLELLRGDIDQAEGNIASAYTHWNLALKTKGELSHARSDRVNTADKDLPGLVEHLREVFEVFMSSWERGEEPGEGTRLELVSGIAKLPDRPARDALMEAIREAEAYGQMVARAKREEGKAPPMDWSAHTRSKAENGFVLAIPKPTHPPHP